MTTTAKRSDPLLHELARQGKATRRNGAARPGRWARYKFWLSAAVLAAPAWYLYQSLNPVFPTAWETQEVGGMSVTPTPYDLRDPYRHGDGWMKDFAVQFCEGCWQRVRLAHFSLGSAPQPLSEELDGLLHGGVHIQHAHAPFAPAIPAADVEAAREQLWLTVEEWSGAVHHVAWTLDGRAVR